MHLFSVVSFAVNFYLYPIVVRKNIECYFNSVILRLLLYLNMSFILEKSYGLIRRIYSLEFWQGESSVEVF